MTNEIIKPCPCGKTPTKLSLSYNGQGTKYAEASGSCCGEWMIEFRTGYHSLNSKECIELAIIAWNKTPRAL